MRAWLEANWNPDRGLVEWRNKLIDSGWGVPSWPKDWYGRELPMALETRGRGGDAAHRCGRRRQDRHPPPGGGDAAGARQRRRRRSKFLRRILTGEDSWCQLFSEPGSGSDLAGAMTRAEFKGNRWVINGQKVWTTSAHHADWGLLLARTDWDAPKHQGLSYFVLDMHQPGVEVRPLRQMNGHASFNQVFFTDAEVPPETPGRPRSGDGWAVATTTLMHERRGADGIGALGHGVRPARAASTTRSGPRPPSSWSRTSGIRSARAAWTWWSSAPRRPGAISDPVVRQEIAKLLTLSKAAEWTARRARAAQCRAGRRGRRDRSASWWRATSRARRRGCTR